MADIMQEIKDAAEKAVEEVKHVVEEVIHGAEAVAPAATPTVENAVDTVEKSAEAAAPTVVQAAEDVAIEAVKEEAEKLIKYIPGKVPQEIVQAYIDKYGTAPMLGQLISTVIDKL